MKQVGILTNTFKQAKKALLKEDKELARDYLDTGIAIIANYYLLDNLKPSDKIEKTTLDIWMERFWYQLEINDLML
jgi:hypothetical protein